MTYHAVARTLDCEGEEVVRTKIAGFSNVIYEWRGSGPLGGFISAMFQNGRLISKAQAGLSDSLLH